jgi:large subunit ribosomal protein L13e
MKHNNEVPNNHFRKEWDLRVRTWFDQPMRKQRRRRTRAPRPADGALRPAVRCMTAKHAARVRLGRGFSVAELREAGVPARLAPTIGIAVDKRRRNRSVEGMQANVQRIKEYRARLIVFPRRAGKPKSGDADEAAIATASQIPKGALLPLSWPVPEVEVRAITSQEKKTHAYRTLRTERSNAKYKGIRDKRAAEKENDAEKADKK